MTGYASLLCSAPAHLRARALCPGRSKIVEGFVSNGALQWPEYVATEFGWFKDNGVSVEMTEGQDGEHGTKDVTLIYMEAFIAVAGLKSGRS